MLRLVLYFDIFHHPLGRAELGRFCSPDEPEQAWRAAEALAARGQVELHEGWCVAPGRADGVPRRRERARNAERLWPWARMAGAIVARFPYVRGVLLTGGLSKGSTARGDDVDFMLLVEPGRVWTLKSLLQVARRSWPEPVRELFCTNYLLATDRPRIDDKNVFTAVELATAVPLYGPEACTELLLENDWAQAYVPGLSWSVQRARNALPLPASTPARAFERGTRALGAEALERRSLQAWDRYWNRKYAHLDEQTRAQRFKRREEIATNHLEDFQGQVIAELDRRLQRVGVRERLELERGGRPVGETPARAEAAP